MICDVMVSDFSFSSEDLVLLIIIEIHIFKITIVIFWYIEYILAKEQRLLI